MRAGRSPALLVAGLLVLSFGLAALYAAWTEPAPPAGPPSSQPAGPSAGSAGSQPAPPPTDSRADRPRTTLSRPPSTVPRQRVAAPPPAPPGPAGTPTPVESGPVDKRGGPDDAAGRQLVDDIKAGMELVADDIEACIDDWAELNPGLNGRVDVGFRFGPEGLTEAWIVDHQDVPAGPLTCFSAAVWEVDWADITEEPLEVTFPFEVEVEAEDDPPQRVDPAPSNDR